MDPAILISNLTKRFETVTAVNQLNLRIEPGEMFGLVGPDGAGKTTTMRMLCGILTPTSGTATVLGKDVVKNPDQVKQLIGYLSQRFSLYGDLTVDENIEFFAEVNKVRDYARRREELLAFTRLADFRNRLAEKLSGGMKQKLGLACTLIHHPKILFLDEPTTGVDPVSRRDFWKILQSLLEIGITIVMTTPYLDEAERCSRVGLIDRGNVMTVASPEQLKASMEGEVIELVCRRVREAQQAVKPLAMVKEVQTFGDRLHVVVERAARDLPPIQAALQKGGIAIESWRVVSPSLENVFISLLTHKEHKEVPV